MDMNMIKRVGLIAAGGVAGGIIGYFLGNLIVDQLEKRHWPTEKELEDEAGGGPFPSEEPKVVYNHDPNKKIKDYTKYAKGELSELVKPYTSSIEEETAKKNEQPEKITIISLDAYENDRIYNKEPITYYENDTTFANVQEEIIDDPVRLFGPNIHLHFGEESKDPDIVYVRNENNGVDYEISRIHNSYSVLIMGMPVEPPKETKSARRRKSAKKVNAHDDEDDEDDTES